MPLVIGSAACSPNVSLSEILALLNEAGDQAVRFGTTSRSGELVPAGGEGQPVVSTEAAHQTTAYFYELFGEGISTEIIPWISMARTQMSPPCRAVALGELYEDLLPCWSAGSTWAVSCFTYSESTYGLKGQGSAPRIVLSVIPFLCQAN